MNRLIAVIAMVVSAFGASGQTFYAPASANTLSGNGFAGIGSSIPTARFHLQQAAGSWNEGLRLSLLGKNWNIVSDNNGDRLIITREQVKENGIVIHNNKVGIGAVNEPATKLEVGGAITVNPSSGSSNFVVFKNNSTNLGLVGSEMCINGSNPSNFAVYAYGNNNLDFWTNGSKRITINGSGSVGVGTTNPQGNFQVNTIRPIIFRGNGGSSIYGSEIGFNAILNTSTGTPTITKLGSTGQKGGATIVVDYSGNMGFMSLTNTDETAMTVNYVPQVTFQNTGNVGVGTNGPLSRLHIANGNGGEQLRFSRGTGTVRFAQDNNQDNLYLFNRDASKTYMVWTAAGKVGINTRTPDTELAVNGTIHTKEVRVDVLSPMTVPDYVFESDYKLMSLTEIEAYVKANNHLPEVPSAKEFVEKGMNLKEMNLLLLKKVEELTLQLIAKEKEIEAVKQQNDSFEQRLEKIEQKLK